MSRQNKEAPHSLRKCFRELVDIYYLVSLPTIPTERILILQNQPSPCLMVWAQCAPPPESGDHQDWLIPISTAPPPSHREWVRGST